MVDERIPDECPHCHASLLGNPIPVEDQHLFGDKTHFSTAMGFYCMITDRTIYTYCPHCNQTIWELYEDARRSI